MQFQLRLKSFNPLWFLGLCFSDQSSSSQPGLSHCWKGSLGVRRGQRAGAEEAGKCFHWGKDGEQAMLLFFVILSCIYGQECPPSR